MVNGLKILLINMKKKLIKINIYILNQYMTKVLKIKIPKYKSKVDVIKLNKLIRLNKVKNKKKVSDLVMCFLKSFNFQNISIKDRFREIKKEYKHVQTYNLKRIIYLCYYVLNYMVYYKNKSSKEKNDLIMKINNYIKKNFRSQENDIYNINNLFYNLKVR